MVSEVQASTSSTTSPLLATLNKSRQTLLFDALPLFSTKSRSKNAPQLTQPPHVLTQLATLRVSIGPHSFSRTKIFLVEWGEAPKKKRLVPQPPPVPPAPAPPKLAPAPAVPQSSVRPPKSAASQGFTQATTSVSTTPAPASSQSAITPALIMRLNAASAKDPLLASILRRAAAGQATDQELAGLARYIEAMRRDEEKNPTPPAPPKNPTPPIPPKQPVVTTATATASEINSAEPSSTSSNSKSDPPGPTEAQVPSISPVKPSILTAATPARVVPEEPEVHRPPPSIVIEFRESPTERFIIPSLAKVTLIPPLLSPECPASQKNVSVLISFFVFAERLGSGRGGVGGGGGGGGGKVNIVRDGSTQGGHFPIPISLIVEECTEVLKVALYKMSRLNGEKVPATEVEWKRNVFAVPPREVNTKMFSSGYDSTTSSRRESLTSLSRASSTSERRHPSVVGNNGSSKRRKLATTVLKRRMEHVVIVGGSSKRLKENGSKPHKRTNSSAESQRRSSSAATVNPKESAGTPSSSGGAKLESTESTPGSTPIQKTARKEGRKSSSTEVGKSAVLTPRGHPRAARGSTHPAVK